LYALTIVVVKQRRTQYIVINKTDKRKYNNEYVKRIERTPLLVTILLLWFTFVEQPIIAVSTIQTQPSQRISSDSSIVQQLKTKGIQFSNNNSVTLLTTGQEKFDDLFKAIDQARSSIHLEYFNFRNDSINKELITRLAKKVKEQVERTKSMMNEKKLANGQATNLSQYLDLYWKHLSQYYQNGKITREQWLQQCNQIKPQTH